MATVTVPEELVWKTAFEELQRSFLSYVVAAREVHNQQKDALEAIKAITSQTQKRPWTALSQIDSLVHQGLAP